ncbi:cell division ATP-binding protein FtsE [Parabacteroides sp. FAFU027]|uniref:cell division ATP-binding protein FtsE n=1 Tax=Parabacteroides sp. FAFU027 TaxID=2922715 RepID=UPI001FAEBE34|nr:ATP-binding cassette domain-containing protein [Parabacteroides sp. FAFU027]
MEVLVHYQGVDISRQDNVVLKNVELELRKGEFLYVIGKVGSGKSSLLKTMYADVPLENGVASVLGYDLRHLKRKQVPYLRRKMGIVFQDFQLLTDRTVFENLRFVLKSTGWKNKEDIRHRINEVLQQVGMKFMDNKMPHELSGGEQQRVVIARALLNHPDIILADEPTGNLDPQTGDQIVQLLQSICETGTAVIMTTHNHRFVKEFPGKVMICEDEQLIISEHSSL